MRSVSDYSTSSKFLWKSGWGEVSKFMVACTVVEALVPNSMRRKAWVFRMKSAGPIIDN